MISTILDISPMPNQISARLTKAMGGMKRKNWRYGSTARRTIGIWAIARPSGTASVQPITQPIARRAALMARFSWSFPLSASSTARASTSAGPETRFAPAIRCTTCQSTSVPQTSALYPPIRHAVTLPPPSAHRGFGFDLGAEQVVQLEESLGHCAAAGSRHVDFHDAFDA